MNEHSPAAGHRYPGEAPSRRDTGRNLVRRTPALVGAALLLSVAATVWPSSAYAASIQVQPASGPPGTHVTVSGAGCGPALLLPLLNYASVSSSTLPLNVQAPVSGAGAWSTTFTVPAGTPAAPAAIVAVCAATPTTIYTPGTFTVTAAPTPTTAPPPPPTTATTNPTTATTKATTSTTKGKGKTPGGSAGNTPGVGSTSGRSTNGGSKGSTAAGSNPESGADLLTGTAAGLRSPELTSDTSDAPGGVGWWWWLLLALVVAALAGAWMWARRRRTSPGAEAPDGDDEGPEAGPEDDDGTADDGFGTSFVDDIPVTTR